MRYRQGNLSRHPRFHISMAGNSAVFSLLRMALSSSLPALLKQKNRMAGMPSAHG
jgi:hypothetical protein